MVELPKCVSKPWRYNRPVTIPVNRRRSAKFQGNQNTTVDQNLKEHTE